MVQEILPRGYFVEALQALDRQISVLDGLGGTGSQQVGVRLAQAKLAKLLNDVQGSLQFQVDAYERAIANEYYGDRVSVMHALAKTLLDTGNTRLAKELLTAAKPYLEKDSAQDIRIRHRYLMGLLNDTLGEDDAALSNLDLAKSIFLESRLLYMSDLIVEVMALKARILDEQGNTGEAIHVLQDAINGNRRWQRGYAGRAYELIRQMDRLTQQRPGNERDLSAALWHKFIYDNAALLGYGHVWIRHAKERLAAKDNAVLGQTPHRTATDHRERVNL